MRRTQRRATRRLTLLLLAGLSVLPLTGCESLCGGTKGVFCPESADNKLNHPPYEAAEGDGLGGGFLINDLKLPVNATRPGKPVRFEARFDDPDPKDDLYYEWDLDGDGEFEYAGYEETMKKVSRSYNAIGVTDVTMRVSDFPEFIGAPGVITETRKIRVVDPDRNRPPEARLAIEPIPAIAGQPVRLDASASTDPDGYDQGALSYRFDVFQERADGLLIRDGVDLQDHPYRPTATVTIDTPGTWTVALTVDDSLGRPSIVRRELVVRAPSESNAAPTAIVSARPSAPFANQEVTFDGSLSSDPEGPIVKYEWDVDGDREQEFVEGGPTQSTSYDSPGERVIWLRVTDTEGATAVARRPLAVRSDITPQASAGRRSPRAAGVPFSARLSGSPSRGGRGELRRSRAGVSLLGVVGRGRLRARVLGAPGRITRAERSLQGFLRSPWATRLSMKFDRRSKRIRAGAVALVHAPRDRRSTACIALRVHATPGRHPTGSFRLLGGTGKGARLRGGGSFRFRLERDGSATVLGRLRARTGAPRAPAAACRSLAARPSRP